MRSARYLWSNHFRGDLFGSQERNMKQPLASKRHQRAVFEVSTSTLRLRVVFTTLAVWSEALTGDDALSGCIYVFRAFCIHITFTAKRKSHHAIPDHPATDSNVQPQRGWQIHIESSGSSQKPCSVDAASSANADNTDTFPCLRRVSKTPFLLTTVVSGSRSHESIHLQADSKSVTSFGRS